MFYNLCRKPEHFAKSLNIEELQDIINYGLIMFSLFFLEGYISVSYNYGFILQCPDFQCALSCQLNNTLALLFILKHNTGEAHGSFLLFALIIFSITTLLAGKMCSIKI